ncbi:putative nuclease HARBI1 [Saccostrea cucullata]|uniref:putative nuclease HARBI1 n=1 Tax=Saccostrea cuccullata TaxID=36930 RepID=UPI002ED1D160
MASLFGKYYFLEEFLLEKQLPCLFNDPVPIFSSISAGQNDPRPKVKDFVDNVVDVWSERIVGVMDGTHIRIVNCPGGQQDYINRKGFASIQAQLIVDDKLMINDVNVGWPGSTHDARVLRNSGIFHYAENNGKILQNHYIIADGAYPLKWWLMTPFRDNGRLNNAQRRYNRIFSSARQCVERAIGHLKGRFRRLQNLHVGSVTHMCNLVISACILHNMCIICDDYIDDFIDMTQAEDINQYPNVFQNAADGTNIRDRLVAIL